MRTSGPTIIERIQMKWYGEKDDLLFALKFAAILSIPLHVFALITLYFHFQRIS